MAQTAQKLTDLTPQEFAHLGEGILAYVKPMRSEEAKRLFPGAGQIQPGIKLFALLAANGAPIMLADTKDAVIHSSWEHGLATVSLH